MSATMTRRASFPATGQRGALPNARTARGDGARGEIVKRSGRTDRAAIILMALDDERSHQILSRLDEDEIRRVSAAMAHLGRAELELVNQTIADFTAEVSRTCNIIGTAETTEKLLLRVLPPDKVAEIMEEVKAPTSKNVWEKLAHVQPQTLASYLRNEYPQTAAVILSRLPAQHAARVLRLLPERVAAEITLRVVRMNSIQRSVLIDIEETLRREFISELARSFERDSASVMAEMLNRSEQDVVNRILTSLEQIEPQVAARIRRIMFTFEDLKRVDPSTFGMLIAEIPAEKLPIALTNVSDILADMFLAAMSERAGNILRDEMASMPTPRRKAIEEAQTEIVAIAKRLSDQGRIVILDPEEEQEEEEPMAEEGM
jgi:flagellar motor switch protein FliG